MRGSTEHTDKEHRNSNHAHRHVCACCRCPCWLIACSFVVQLSQIPPFSPSTPLPSLSFFLFSFILSLPCSASPKTHSLLATKAFSSKNKWPSHDRQDKIWFNYDTCQKSLEFGHWSRELQCEGMICLMLPDQRRPLVTAPASLSHCVYNK